MARTIVIRSANFSANKLTTVVLSDKPCTGIELSEDTAAIASIGGTETLTATLTPADTTDFVAWSSSDGEVATVEDGVIIATGVGSATITATCGTQTATCEVTVTNALAYQYKISKRVELPGNQNYVPVTNTDAQYATGYSATTLTGKKMILDQVSYSNMWAAMLNAGTTKLSFTVPSGIRATVFFVNSETPSATSGKEAYAQFISGDASPWDTSVSTGDREVTIPEGADAVVFCLQYSGGTITDDIMAAIEVVES